MASQKVSMVVTPAKAGVQNFFDFLDSRLRGNDRKGCFRTSYECINLDRDYEIPLKTSTIFFSNP